MDDQAVFGKHIRAARDAANISREVAAERAGITPDYLGEVERGEKWPTLPVIRSIARSLSVSPEKFFEFENEKEVGGTTADHVHRILEERTPEQQRQVLRVIKALFNL
jgi:transcriptional regulator with XRE-family HTH domain